LNNWADISLQQLAKQVSRHISRHAQWTHTDPAVLCQMVITVHFVLCLY